ncbi:glycosyltransferase [Candidatus Omnitrophota bacterium]
MNKIIEQSVVEKVARGAGISFFGSLFGAGIYGVTHLIIARLLGAELFGIYSLGFAIFGIAEIISRVGLHEGAVRYVALYVGEGDYKRAKGVVFQSIVFSFCAGIGIGVILFFTAGLFAEHIFRNPHMEKVIKIFSLGVPFEASLIVALYVTRGFQKMRYFVWVRNFFNPLVNLSLIGILYALGFKLYGAVAAWLISSALGFLLTLYFISRELRPAREVKPVFETAKLIKFSLPLSISDVLFFIIMWTDALMLGYFRNESDVGIYRAAVHVAFILTIFLRSFIAIFSPIIADLYNRKKRTELEDLFKITTKWMSFLTLPFCIIALFSSQEIMGLFGVRFVFGAQVLIILVLAQLFRCSIGPARHILMMSGHQNVILVNDIVVASVNVVLNLFLIPRYGMSGAAVATGISILGMSAVELGEAYYFLKMHSFKRSFIKGILAGGVTYCTVYLLQPGINEHFVHAGKIIAVSVVVLVTYIVSLLIQKLDKEDILVFSVIAGKLMSKFKKEGRRESGSSISLGKAGLLKSDPLISFIIVTRNRKRNLQEAIASVLKQDYKNFEIVVVDNGSEDGTDQLFKHKFALETITYIKLPENKGAGEGRNVAIKQAKGDIIIGLDDDAELVEKDATKKIIEKFVHDESIGVLAFKIIDYTTRRLQRAAFPTRKKYISPDKEFETTWFIAAGCAIRKIVFKHAGIYEHFSYKGNEEIDFSYRILDAGFRIMYFPNVTVLHKKKQDERIAGSSEYFTTFLENRLKVAFLNLPLRYVATTSLLWTIRIATFSRGNICAVARGWWRLLRGWRQVARKRNVIKKDTVYRIRRLNGPLIY